MADDKLKYSDFIQEDDSIATLINELTRLNEIFGQTSEMVRKRAQELVAALQGQSGATKKGREAIDLAAVAAERLVKADGELVISQSSIGQTIAVVNAQIAKNNKLSKEAAARANAAAGSYRKLSMQVKDLKERYQELSAAERSGEKGDRILAQYARKAQALQELNKELKSYLPTLSKLEQEEQKLAYLLSEEGQQYLRVKQQISEVTRASKQRSSVIKDEVKSQAKLVQVEVQSDAGMVSILTSKREANRLAKATMIANQSEEGSYNQLYNQYILNKAALNALSAEYRENTKAGQDFEALVRGQYLQLRKMQEAAGNYTLGVGDYANAFRGLGFSVQQVVRELPSAAISLNTLFLAVSNNIPILVDDIRRLRMENAAFIKENRPEKVKSVGSAIASSLFSWQTAIVVLLAAFAMFGEEIIDWIGSLFKAKNAILSVAEMTKAMSEEIKSSNANYGDSVKKFKELQTEWDKLKSLKDRTEFVKKYKDELKECGLKIDDVRDAEKAFNKESANILKAFKLRAKAAAYGALATKKYQEALEAEVKREAAKAEGPNTLEKIAGTVVEASAFSAIPGGQLLAKTASLFGYDIKGYTSSKLHEKYLDDLDFDKVAAETAADQYLQKEEELEKQYKKLLGDLYLNPDDDIKGKKEKKSRGRTPKDATDNINKYLLDAQKKYEKSQTELIENETDKRLSQTEDEAENEVRQTQEKQRKLLAILANEGGKYSDLTEEQLANIRKAHDFYSQYIINLDKKRFKEIEDIQKEGLKTQYETELESINNRLEVAKEGSEEYLNLRLGAIRKERDIALLENALRAPEQRLDPSEIVNKYDSAALLATGEFRRGTFTSEQALREAEFKGTDVSSRRASIFELEQELRDLENQRQLAEQGMLQMSDKDLPTIKQKIENTKDDIAELTGLEGFLGVVSENGLGHGILDALGFNDKEMEAFDMWTDHILDNLNEILAAEIEAAQAAVEAAQERVNAAQSAYDAEIEARNNGYANNVATAKKELQLEKKNQLQKQRLLAEAQRKQEAVNTVSQTSNLITASAAIWKTFSESGTPWLAPAMIATMWASFIAAKIKARQITAAEEEYGEGGLEFLEGGSHASGHDIDLGTTNSRGKRMKAEGGEALAIINKRSTTKYKKLLPTIISSLNSGNFEDRYSRAFEVGNSNLIINQAGQAINLAQIEKDVRAIKEQSNNRMLVTPDRTIVYYKNTKRIIRNG